MLRWVIEYVSVVQSFGRRLSEGSPVPFSPCGWESRTSTDVSAAHDSDAARVPENGGIAQTTSLLTSFAWKAQGPSRWRVRRLTRA